MKLFTRIIAFISLLLLSVLTMFVSSKLLKHGFFNTLAFDQFVARADVPGGGGSDGGDGGLGGSDGGACGNSSSF